MSLLDLIKKQIATATNQIIPMQNQYTYTLSNHFKGYRKLGMCVSKEGDAEKNSVALRNAPLEGQQIVFVSGYHNGQRKKLSVYIYGKHVGTIYDDRDIYDIENGIIRKVYAKMEDDVIVDEKGSTLRPRVYLFAMRGD